MRRSFKKKKKKNKAQDDYVPPRPAITDANDLLTR